MLPSNQRQIIEQAKFTYSPLGKAFERQTKTIEDQRKKQVKALKDLDLKEETKSIAEIFPKDYESDEMKNKLSKIKRH